jgi:hypothetical protein
MSGNIVWFNGTFLRFRACRPVLFDKGEGVTFHFTGKSHPPDLATDG